jgi:ubiquitin carboxyl-terminal hydrolase 36/42
MGEAAAAEAQGPLLHRRIEFHAATTTATQHHAAAGGATGFRVETLYQGDDRGLAAAAARSEARDKGEPSGFDAELAAARVYLRRIVSVSAPPHIFLGGIFFDSGILQFGSVHY